MLEDLQRPPQNLNIIETNKEEVKATKAPDISGDDFDPNEAQIIAVKMLRTIDSEISSSLKNLKENRTDISPLITYLDELCRGQERPTQGMLEALVSAHKARADIDISVTRVLDTVNKFIVATKNSNIMAPKADEELPDEAHLRKLLDQSGNN